MNRNAYPTSLIPIRILTYNLHKGQGSAILMQSPALLLFDSFFRFYPAIACRTSAKPDISFPAEIEIKTSALIFTFRMPDQVKASECINDLYEKAIKGHFSTKTSLFEIKLDPQPFGQFLTRQLIEADAQKPAFGLRLPSYYSMPKK